MANIGISQVIEHSNVTEANVNISLTSSVPPNVNFQFSLLLYGVLGIVVMLMNLYVIFTYIRSKDIRDKSGNVYAFYLAVADFFVGSFLIFFSTLWVFLFYPELPYSVCHIWSIIKHFAILYASLVIVLLSYDRLQLVTSPLKYHLIQTTGRIHRIVLITSSICCTYCAATYFLSLHFDDQHGDATSIRLCIPVVVNETIYLVILNIIEFVIPFLILVVINAGFYWKLVYKLHNISNTQLEERRPPKRQQYIPNDPEHRINTNRITFEEQFEIKLEKQTGEAQKDTVASQLPVWTPEHVVRVANANHVLVRNEKDSEIETLGDIDSRNPIGDMTEQYSKKDKRIKKEDNSVYEAARKKENDQLRRIAQKLATYVGVFLFCWLPFRIVSSLPLCGIPVPDSLLTITSFILLFNSVLNPLLYGVFARFGDINCCSGKRFNYT
ncbi:histamine H4 receptor-like [Apostichopus japonicus]|uniref:histamine H4 receptor-like n=1 Tax=Stichopus japonicus TaxID=307972 RepID=UPI003AB69AEB